ncbi:hypothetical protein G6F56_002329 [Rhizopus delemar]|nr:hypothetical protein G6F56_002329 [Rhizopus delemar]
MQKLALEEFREWHRKVEESILTNPTLIQFQKEYQNKVKSTKKDLDPNKLQNELQILKSNFERIQQNYIITKQRVEYLQTLYDNHFEVSIEESDNMDNTNRESIVEEMLLKTESLGQRIGEITKITEESRQQLQRRLDDNKRILEDMTQMENEINKMETYAKNLKGMTIEEAREKVLKQDQQLAEFTKQINEKNEIYEEQRFIEEDLTTSVETLTDELERYKNEADRLLKINAKRDPIIESEYKK